MPTLNQSHLSIFDLHDGYRTGTFTPIDVTENVLDRIKRFNSDVKAFCFIDSQVALKGAQASTKRWIEGRPLSLLDGIPCGIKDVTSTVDWRARKGSRATTPGAPPATEVPMIARLREAGATFVGLTNTSEFGWKGITDNGLYGATSNPWDLDLTPGGSSGGSAVAIAMDMCTIATASDAAGSIRIPASFCGIFGFKPSYGRVPTLPLSNYGSISHQGVIARTAVETLAVLDIICAPDPNGAASISDYHPLKSVKQLTDLSGWNIAYSPSFNGGQNDPCVTKQFETFLTILADQGASLREVAPDLSSSEALIKTIWSAAVSKIIADHDPELLDPDLVHFAATAPNVGVREYLEAQAQRTELTATMNRFHREYDLLVTPTLPTLPFPLHQLGPAPDCEDWFTWAYSCYPFNLTQQPAASLYCGMSASGLPIGVQVVGPYCRDENVLSVCRFLESAIGTADFPSTPRQ